MDAVPLDVLFRERLFSQLANRNEPLLRLKIIGRFPESELPQRSASLDACVTGTRSYGGAAEKVRDANALILPSRRPPPAHLTGAPVGMHMPITGYADLADAEVSGVRTDL